jgi:hypothetical protein
MEIIARFWSCSVNIFCRLEANGSVNNFFRENFDLDSICPSLGAKLVA